MNCQLPSLLCLFVMVVFISKSAYGQQSLQEAPSNATVVRGNTAILRCLVANRKGAVQWAKNGIMLGYAREIPGFPRYHVIGNESAGEFHLQIVNTTISDEAEYQCQVAPGPGGVTGSDPPLVGAAYLSILVPVENVYIEGVTNNSVLYVNSSQPSLTLTCRCVGVKPAAAITWLRDDVIVVTSSSGVVAGSGQGSLLRDSWSVLRTQPETVGGAAYTCRAGNDVIVGGALPHVDVIVRVMVYSAPLPPVITGYTTDQQLTAGQVLSLHCRTQGGAAPPSDVYFFRTSDGLQSNRIEVLNGSRCIPLDSDTLDCSLTLTIQPSDNGAVIGCSAVSGDVTANVLTSSIKLSVQFGPTDVSISGSRDVTSGSSITLRCETGVANPAASVLWFAGGHQLTSVATSEATHTASAGFIKVSSLSLQVTAADNGVLIECRAANSATVGREISASLQLNVYFPPSLVILTTGSSSLRANQPFNVTCTSTSSNPPAKLSIWKGAESIEAARSAEIATAENGGTTSSGRWEVIPTPEDDGKMLTCIAGSWNTTLAAWSPVSSRAARLQVYYPPYFQVHQSPLQLTILEHNSTALNATAAANPRNVTYTWTYYASPPLGGATGSDVTIAADGPLLRLDDVTRADAGRYQCAAVNELGTSLLDVIVDVLFPAEILNVTSQVVTVNQSQPVTLECFVRANPIDTNRLVTWYKDPETLINGAGGGDEEDVVATFFDAATGVARLVIKRTILADCGVFRCVAFNGFGRPVNASVTLYVLESESASPTSAGDVRGASNHRDVILIAVLTSSLVGVAALALVVMVTLCVRWRRRKRRSASLWPRNSTKLDQKFAFDRGSSLNGSLPPSFPPQLPTEKAGGEGGVASNDSDSELSQKPATVDNNNSSPGRTFYLTSASYDDTCHCDKYSPAAAEIFYVPTTSTQQTEPHREGQPPGKDELESVVPLWALDPNVQRSRSYTGGQQRNAGVKWNDTMSEPDPESLMNYIEQLRDLQRCASTGRRSVPPMERVPMFFEPSATDLPAPVFRRQPPPHPPPRAAALTSSGSSPRTVAAVFRSPPPPPVDSIHVDRQPDLDLRSSSMLRQLEINNNNNWNDDYRDGFQ